MHDIVILGAGLTGLSTAYHLEQLGCYDYQLIEKEPTVGGLCRSIKHDGFTFDYTGHLLHCNNTVFQDFLEHKVGLHHFNTIQRRSFVYSHDRYTRYPYQTNLYGLPTDVIVDCIENYLNRPQKNSCELFSDWVMNNFGAGFARHFFYPYQTKIFDVPVEQLSSSWTGRFVPQTSIHELLRGALEDRSQDTVGYNAHFLYPKTGGIMFWIQHVANLLTNAVHTNKKVTAIDLTQKVVICADGTVTPYSKLVTTLALNELLKIIIEPSSCNLTNAHTHLRCNSVVNFNIGVRRPDLSDKHWIYFPEPHYPFYRIGFWHNFSSAMTPPHCSSLYGEVAFLNRDANHISTTIAHAKKIACKLFSISQSDIALEYDIFIPHAYVIFDTWRDKHLPSLLSKLEDYSIFSVGRYGAWKYSSMQEGFLEGKDIAEKMVSFRKKRNCHETIKSYQP